jgi:hypothetical protein
VLWQHIRIRINFVGQLDQEGAKTTHNIEKCQEISCIEVLDAFF